MLEFLSLNQLMVDDIFIFGLLIDEFFLIRCLVYLFGDAGLQTQDLGADGLVLFDELHCRCGTLLSSMLRFPRISACCCSWFSSYSISLIYIAIICQIQHQRADTRSNIPSPRPSINSIRSSPEGGKFSTSKFISFETVIFTIFNQVIRLG